MPTMRGKITRITQETSRYGDLHYFICFKMEDGKSARSYVYMKNGNYRRWCPHIVDFQKQLASGQEVWLEGLQFWNDPKKRLIDADSQFQLSKQPATA